MAAVLPTSEGILAQLQQRIRRNFALIKIGNDYRMIPLSIHSALFSLDHSV